MRSSFGKKQGDYHCVVSNVGTWPLLSLGAKLRKDCTQIAKSFEKYPVGRGYFDTYAHNIVGPDSLLTGIV